MCRTRRLEDRQCLGRYKGRERGFSVGIHYCFMLLASDCFLRESDKNIICISCHTVDLRETWEVSLCCSSRDIRGTLYVKLMWVWYMMKHVKWQEVAREVKVEMVVFGQVIRGGRIAVPEGRHSQREGRTVCVYAYQQSQVHRTCLNLHVLSLKWSQLSTEIVDISQVDSNRAKK